MVSSLFLLAKGGSGKTEMFLSTDSWLSSTTLPPTCIGVPSSSSPSHPFPGCGRPCKLPSCTFQFQYSSDLAISGWSCLICADQAGIQPCASSSGQNLVDSANQLGLGARECAAGKSCGAGVFHLVCLFIYYYY